MAPKTSNATLPTTMKTHKKSVLDDDSWKEVVVVDPFLERLIPSAAGAPVDGAMLSVSVGVSEGFIFVLGLSLGMSR
jgi:hypothetical protein